MLMEILGPQEGVGLIKKLANVGTYRVTDELEVVKCPVFGFD